MNDSELFSEAAARLKSMANELMPEAHGDHEAPVYKSGFVCDVMAYTLLKIAAELKRDDYLQRVIAGEKSIAMTKQQALPGDSAFDPDLDTVERAQH